MSSVSIGDPKSAVGRALRVAVVEALPTAVAFGALALATSAGIHGLVALLAVAAVLLLAMVAALEYRERRRYAPVSALTALDGATTAERIAARVVPLACGAVVFAFVGLDFPLLAAVVLAAYVVVQTIVAWRNRA